MLTSEITSLMSAVPLKMRYSDFDSTCRRMTSPTFHAPAWPPASAGFLLILRSSVSGLSYLLIILCISTRKRIVEHDVVAFLLELSLVNLCSKEGT
jgi:hypothetical protein